MQSDATDRDDSWSRGLSLKWALSLVLAALVAAEPAYDLYEAGTVSWVWLAVGGASWPVVAGPVASSGFGRRFGAWFRSIGVLGRSVVIFGFAGAFVTLLVWVHPPSVPSDSFALGVVFGVAAATLWRDLRSD